MKIVNSGGRKNIFMTMTTMNKEMDDKEKYPIVCRLTKSEYNLVMNQRRFKEREELRKKWRREHNIPDPKPNYDEFGTVACTEDGEYLVGGEPDDYYDKKKSV